jgi:hypothetical protein
LYLDIFYLSAAVSGNSLILSIVVSSLLLSLCNEFFNSDILCTIFSKFLFSFFSWFHACWNYPFLPAFCPPFPTRSISILS